MGPSGSEAGSLPRLDSYKLGAEQSVGSRCKNINKNTFLKRRVLEGDTFSFNSSTFFFFLKSWVLGTVERRIHMLLQDHSLECLSYAEKQAQSPGRGNW